MPATGSENSNIIQKHPQNLPSEGEAANTRQKEGSSLQGTVQGLPIGETGRALEKQICENKTAVEMNARPQDFILQWI